MRITNKLESTKKITELSLNKLPEQLFKNGEEEKVLEFIEKHPAKYYAIRDKAKAGGVFKLKIEKENILDEIKDYTLYSINVSSANYEENQVLVGEILILSNNEIYAALSTNKTYSARDAAANPEFNLKTTIFNDKTLNKVPYFDILYNYITTNHLQDVIVEFSLFDKKVGIKNENIVIYEIRTDY